MSRWTAIFIVAAMGVAPAAAHGAILANYTFDTGSGDLWKSTGHIAESTPGDFTLADGNRDLRSSTEDNHVAIWCDVTADTQAEALDGDYIWSFTVTATNPGDVLNLTSLTFIAPDMGGTHSGFINVQSSVGGFGSTNPVLGSFATPNDDDDTDPNPSVDLSGAAFQGLSSIEFRFAIHSSSDADNRVIRADTFVLNGAVVPEPASAALLLTGAGLALLPRRRRLH